MLSKTDTLEKKIVVFSFNHITTFYAYICKVSLMPRVPISIYEKRTFFTGSGSKSYAVKEDFHFETVIFSSSYEVRALHDIRPP